MVKFRLIAISSALSLLSITAQSLQAQERIEMQGTAIIGNKELPKVLYIVPWKGAEPVELGQPVFTSILDQSLQPVERPTFQRQVRFYETLYLQDDTVSQP